MTKLLRLFKYLPVLIILVPFLFLSKDVFGADTVTIKKSQISLVKEFKDVNDKHYHPQGGVITEKYYVFSSHNSDSTTNYIYVVNRKNGDLVWKKGTKSLGHMNIFFYDWGKNEVRIMDEGSKTAGCIVGLGGKAKNIKLKGKDYNCASKVASDFSRIKNWRPQGRGKWGDYILKLHWKDPGGQGYARHDAMIYAYKNKSLVKKFYIPISTIKKGEIEDVSFDENGDVYLLYGGYRNGTVWGGTTMFYKINRSVFAKHGVKLEDLTRNKDEKEKEKAKEKTEKKKESKEIEKETSTKKENNVDDNTSKTGKDNDSSEGRSSSSKDDCAIILTDYCDDGEKGVENVLNLILDILTYGVSIAAIIGISISGITYLTAKGNEQQTIKAKRRIYEIVIGLVVYAALYALLKFLNIA